MCLSRARHRAQQQRGGRPWWRGLACWWAPSLLQVRLRAVRGLLGCAQNFWKTEGINDNPAYAKRRWRECFPHLRYSIFQAVFRLRQAKCPQGSFLLPSLQENLTLVSKWWMPWQVSEVSYCILINSIWFSFFLSFSFPPFWLLPSKFKFPPSPRPCAVGDTEEETPCPTTVGSSRAMPCPGPAHSSAAGTQRWHERRTSAVRGSLKNTIRLKLEKNINTEGVNWKPAGWESYCTVVGMQQPQGPLNDWWHTRDIVKLPFLLVLESYVLKDYSLEEVKRILIFGLDINLRCKTWMWIWTWTSPKSGEYFGLGFWCETCLSLDVMVWRTCVQC